MASNRGCTAETVLTALHQAISRQEAVNNGASQNCRGDDGLINQTQMDQDECMDYAKHLSSVDPGEIIYEIPLRLETAGRWLPLELQRFVSTPITPTTSNQYPIFGGHDQASQQSTIRSTIMNIGTGIVEQIKRISRPTTLRSRSPEDFPLREPYVQQQINQIEHTLHQRQQFVSQKPKKKTIEYHEPSPPPSNSVSSEARWNSAKKRELAAAKFELIKAELEE